MVLVDIFVQRKFLFILLIYPPSSKIFYSCNLSFIWYIFSILAMQIFIFVLFMSPYCVESIDADYIQYLVCVLLGITEGNTRAQII